jgi:predicted RNA binding protein YcfA (HicA-like mRNA interferase family)
MASVPMRHSARTGSRTIAVHFRKDRIGGCLSADGWAAANNKGAHRAMTSGPGVLPSVDFEAVSA